MLPNFTLFASKGSDKKKVPCPTATEAADKLQALVRQGWGVSVADHYGMPISVTRIGALAREEAGKVGA